MQAELLEWNFWHGAELYLAGLKFVKYFGPAYKTFSWH